MVTRYVRDKIGFDRLATSTEVKGFAAEVGDVYSDVLREIAPVGKPPRDPHPGLYRDSVESGTEIVAMPQGPRWAAVISAHVRYAAALEFGSKDDSNPPRPLTKLLDIVDAADPNIARKTARKRTG